MKFYLEDFIKQCTKPKTNYGRKLETRANNGSKRIELLLSKIPVGVKFTLSDAAEMINYLMTESQIKSAIYLARKSGHEIVMHRGKRSHETTYLITGVTSNERQNS